MAQAVTFNGRKRVRKFFGHIAEVAEMPNLIEVQMSSYDQFLMVDEPEGGRPDEGLQAVFKSVFPITDFSGGAGLGDQLNVAAFGFADFAAVQAVTTDTAGGALIQLDSITQTFP